MKYTILFVLLAIVACQSCGSEEPTGRGVCTHESTDNNHYCCFIRGLSYDPISILKGSVYTIKQYCASISKSDIDNDQVHNYIASMEKSLWKRVDDLYCGSSFLTIGFLAFLTFLF